MLMKNFLFTGLLAGVMAVGAGCGRQEPVAKTETAAQPTVAPARAVEVLPMMGKAPAWTLRDLDGREVKSADFKGKVVIVDFWATWCPPCRKEIPHYVEMQKKYADRGLVIVGFSVDDGGPELVKEFSVQMKMNYPILMADAETAGLFGGVQGFPTAFVIDREGNVRHVKLGLARNEKAYEELIVSLL